MATPSEADSVKLLTVHRAKGLEWDSVFLVGVCAEKFPVNRARSQWTTVGMVLPAPLRGDAADVPQLRGYDKPAIVALTEPRRRRTRPSRSSGSATSRSPGPSTSCGSRRTSGARPG